MQPGEGTVIKAKVTAKGLLIPKKYFFGAEQVDIHVEDNRIIIKPILEQDPILGLGKTPVSCGLRDASENHDRYLYGSCQSSRNWKSAVR